jgi:hypothetical protein
VQVIEKLLRRQRFESLDLGGNSVQPHDAVSEAIWAERH